MAVTRKPPPGNARRVVCPGRNLRGVLTNKHGHVVQLESELEHTLVLLLERDPSVADYRSQPEALRFRDAAGRPRTDTPDFRVWRTTTGTSIPTGRSGGSRYRRTPGSPPRWPATAR